MIFGTETKDPGQVFKNQKAAAAHCGVTVRTLQRWLKDGMPRGRDGKWSLGAYGDGG